jgi:hypothetical protein
VPDAPWSRAAIGAFAVDVAGGTACLLGADGLERWSVDGVAPDGRLPSADGFAVAASPAGCLVLGADGGLVHAGRDGRGTPIGPGPFTRLLRDGSTTMALDARGILFLRDGAPADRLDTVPAPTAAALDGDAVLVGHADGTLRRFVGGAPDPTFALRELPDVPVTAIAALPSGLIAVGQSNGLVGLWDARTGGAAAVRRSLDGEVTALRRVGDLLVAGTDAGDSEIIDLGLLRADRCAILRDLVAHAPVRWRAGRVEEDARVVGCP